MTHFFELRLFNRSGKNCFSVKEYGSIDKALEDFNEHVGWTERLTQRIKDADNLSPKAKKVAIGAFADQIQLVRRDDNYTGLEVVRNWQTF